MAIKKYYVNSPKPDYPYDRNARKYFSYGFDIWINGARRQERGFPTKQDAETAVKTLRSKKTRSSADPYLIELFQKKLDDMPAGKDRVRAKRVFNAFLKCTGDKKIKVTDVKKAHFKAYTIERVKAGVSLATIRREFVPVAAALNNAGEYFEALEDHRPSKIPWPQVPRARKHRTISAQERSRLLEYLLEPRRPTEHQPKMYEARRRTGLFLQFCLLTASRPGEVARLRKANIDWPAGTVAIVGTKTRKTDPDPVRVLRITPTMAAILKERESKARGEFLFFNGGKITARAYKVLKDACEANDIAYGRDAVDGITFHTARHTATTELSRSGLVDTRTVGEFTGHADESMILYYTHAHPEMIQKAADHLEQKMGFPLYRGEFLESESENN